MNRINIKKWADQSKLEHLFDIMLWEKTFVYVARRIDQVCGTIKNQGDLWV